jgi:hypothetical protein
MTCAVGSVADIEAALGHFAWVEPGLFPLKRSLGFDEGLVDAETLAGPLRPYRERLSGIHLEINYLQRGEDIRPMLQRDLAVVTALGVRRCVAHLLAPRDAAEVDQQLAVLHEAVLGLGVLLNVENLGDFKNRSPDFPWIRQPLWMAETLEAKGWEELGLCLDYSHAGSRAMKGFDYPAVRRQIATIHLSGGKPGVDAHAPIGPETDPAILAESAALAAGSRRDGVLVFEHHSVADSVSSLDYLRRERPDWIANFES